MTLIVIESVGIIGLACVRRFVHAMIEARPLQGVKPSLRPLNVQLLHLGRRTNMSDQVAMEIITMTSQFLWLDAKK